MKVSFDFDDTLHHEGRPLWPAFLLVRWHASRGDRVIIITTRTASHERPIWFTRHEPLRVLVAEFVKHHRLPIREVIYTTHRAKAAFLVRHKIDLHYDNDPLEVRLANQAGIKAVLLQGVALGDRVRS